MGVAIAAIGGNPIAIAVAALTVGALVVRKYWQPIAAWITGVFDGIRTAVGPGFAELGAALAPLKPVWDGITGAVSAALNWFMKLLQPVNMTQEQLKKAGGDATMMHLPAMGIKGNSHMLMQDKNSDQIAELVIGWIDKHVESRNRGTR